MILESLYSKLSYYNHGVVGRRISQLICYTELIIAGNNEEDHDDDNCKSEILIRSCPNYRSERDWFDWALVDWGEDYGSLEAQILLLIDMESIQFASFNSELSQQMELNVIHDIIPHKKMAMIHSCAEYESNQDLNKRKSMSGSGFIKNKLCKFMDMETNYQLVSVESIVSSSFVVVDSAVDNYATYIPGMSKKVCVIEKQTKWHLHFIDYTNQTLLRNAKKKKDREYPRGNNRHKYEG